MSKSMTPAAGADWTKLLADPDIASHLGTLLQIYRESPAGERDEALVKALRQIKNLAKGKPDGLEKTSAVVPGVPEPQPVAATLKATPPFEPDIFTPSWGEDRRRYPRMKCFVAVELRIEGSSNPIWGNLANASLGGCLVETSTSLDNGEKLNIGLWIANGEIWVKGMVLSGMVARSNPSFGIRIRFSDLEAPERETLRQFLQYVASTTKNYQRQDNYLTRMKR
jgi:PilZ domain